MESKVRHFVGNGDVRVFLEKVSLHSALKGYDGEKTAQDLASKLEGRAFDIYMRLADTDKKDASKIKNELLKEFQVGSQDREVAIHELATRHRKPEESPQTFAFKIMELVRLAYPSFDNINQETIAKGYFMKGIHPKMQIALKSLPKFSDLLINDVAKETVRLQLAGIESYSAPHVANSCMSMANRSSDVQKDFADSIVDKVVAKMTEISFGNEYPINAACEDKGIAFAANSASSRLKRFQRSTRGRSFFYGNKARSQNRGYKPNNPQGNNTLCRKCCSCQSTDHLVKNCPTRFCQACGQRGHDSWETSCPNFQ